MTRIVSTKKLAPNQKQFLLNAGMAVVDENFIETKSIDFSLDTINENLIFTSSNAVKAVANHPDVQQIRRNPCFATAPKTAELLDEVGFTVIESADDAAGLGMIIEQKYSKESFTFFCGNLRLETLPVGLKNGVSNSTKFPFMKPHLNRSKLPSPTGYCFLVRLESKAICWLTN